MKLVSHVKLLKSLTNRFHTDLLLLLLIFGSSMVPVSWFRTGPPGPGPRAGIWLVSICGGPPGSIWLFLVCCFGEWQLLWADEGCDELMWARSVTSWHQRVKMFNTITPWISGSSDTANYRSVDLLMVYLYVWTKMMI